MKKKITSLCSVIAVIMMTACASIVSKTSYPIMINSQPSEATISVTNSKQTEIYKGKTPASVILKAGDGYFKKATYQVKFMKEGYNEKIVPINFKLDGWYWGNILFGGFIGLLIVDPATGAMYKLDTEFLNETLTQSSVSQDQTGLRIYGMNEIPPLWKEHLVLLSK
jgi:hypothetical protein